MSGPQEGLFVSDEAVVAPGATEPVVAAGHQAYHHFWVDGFRVPTSSRLPSGALGRPVCVCVRVLCRACRPVGALTPAVSVVAADSATPRATSPVVSPTSPPPEEEEEEEEVVAPRRSSRKRKHPLASDEEEEESESSLSSDDEDHHAALVRVCCLRCAKHLAQSPEFSCVFPKTSTKCTRCTRLKDKCIPVSLRAVLFGPRLRCRRRLGSAGAAVGLRHASAATKADCRALPAQVHVATSVALPATDVNAAILANQVEMLAVLRQIRRGQAAEKRERRKAKDRG
ncbi:hypothetical protein VC83_07890 [Pseudogymnoascus destructans]|uniref:Uncharacterized protein n=1 Tax=Pseudogymnoascus destructans TaxID=655981 RepID=A0A177A3Z6_9PEZI|nr:uncharacterized protein VC83_07890 [Pseudogymnoascus destructans]OAF55803.1 hypothetical protein VC83_07890 [Pseudogymnoascus destructans]